MHQISQLVLHKVELLTPHRPPDPPPRSVGQCALNMEPGVKSRFDPLNFWHDHEACWQMQYRGNLGETLLHVLIICNTRTHTRIAKILLKCFPKLAVDVVEGQEYLGKTAMVTCEGKIVHCVEDLYNKVFLWRRRYAHLMYKMFLVINIIVYHFI